jgi:hypothetical protein
MENNIPYRIIMIKLCEAKRDGTAQFISRAVY